jgi:beta-glucosidase/6-phospho-beta-glucosidase/beta-galactosidase
MRLHLYYILTLIIISTQSFANDKVLATFPKDFFFGVANAPAQVEDQLQGAWLEWAENGKVPAFYNQDIPEDRIRFWTEPEREIKLAKQLGLKVFRLGISWMRLFPTADTTKPDLGTIKRYREILQLIKKNDMKVMFTLFHHAEPTWTIKQKSWASKKMVDSFMTFAKSSVDNFGDLVDYWITFNEANIYILMTQIANAWPNYIKKRRPLLLFNLGPIKGGYERSLKNMATAHNQIYSYIKKKSPHIPVGIAHNVGNYTGESWVSKIFANISKKKFNYVFFDMIAKNMDYIGINYYGAEVVKGTTVRISENYEYSDSGRAVSPNGFKKVIMELHQRYNIKKKGRRNAINVLPFIITENGVADDDGWLRSSYIVEHLLALKSAMNEGIQVLGYIAWSLSDNLEWSDGYCPKFGMVAVDRSNNMKRTPRPGFYTYREIVKNKSIKQSLRSESWKKVQSKVGQSRSFCRAEDGESALNEPRYVPVKNIDWKFKN